MHEVCQKYLCVAVKEDISWANERENWGLQSPVLRQLQGIPGSEVDQTVVLL